jgi:hypothetical protein
VPNPGHPAAVVVDRDIGILVGGLELLKQQLFVFPQVPLVEHPKGAEVNLLPVVDVIKLSFSPSLPLLQNRLQYNSSNV